MLARSVSSEAPTCHLAVFQWTMSHLVGRAICLCIDSKAREDSFLSAERPLFLSACLCVCPRVRPIYPLKLIASWESWLEKVLLFFSCQSGKGLMSLDCINQDRSRGRTIIIIFGRLVSCSVSLLDVVPIFCSVHFAGKFLGLKMRLSLIYSPRATKTAVSIRRS